MDRSDCTNVLAEGSSKSENSSEGLQPGHRVPIDRALDQGPDLANTCTSPSSRVPG